MRRERASENLAMFSVFSTRRLCDKEEQRVLILIKGCKYKMITCNQGSMVAIQLENDTILTYTPFNKRRPFRMKRLIMSKFCIKEKYQSMNSLEK